MHWKVSGRSDASSVRSLEGGYGIHILRAHGRIQEELGDLYQEVARSTGDLRGVVFTMGTHAYL
jgi:hypothetical protein